MEFDLVVIGAGPGGYVAALRASQLKMKVAIIEKDELGGICLNWGCIPTKALLKSAYVLSLAKHATKYGLVIDKAEADFSAVIQGSREVSKKLVQGVSFLLKRAGVTVIKGTASFDNPHQLTVKSDSGQQTVKFKKAIIATGARARTLDILPPNGTSVWTYYHALQPKALPKTMVVIGSGAIGVEFAYFYKQMGVEVTLLEVADRILPNEDKSVSDFMLKQFEKQGIQIKTGIKINTADITAQSVTLNYTYNQESVILKADVVLSAVGVVPNAESIGLDKAGVTLQKNGCIAINDYWQTQTNHIYAIGDVAGGPMLAHKASMEAELCAEHIAGLTVHAIHKQRIPGCTYTTPEIASVGLTENKAKELNIPIKVGNFPFVGNGKAIASRDTEGFIKTIFNAQTGELLGVHMVGMGVTEMIHSAVLMMNLETTEEEIINTIFPHPSLSEMIKESVLSAYNRPLHI